MRRWVQSVFAALLTCAGGPASGAPPTKPDETTVVVTIDSTLATGSGRIRQFAFDGDPATLFASEENAREIDHFTLVLDKSVALSSISVLTGRMDQSDRLTSGTLEVSEDGTTFSELAKFADGTARAEGNGRKVRAIRVKPGAEFKHPLVIQEFTINSDPLVARFKYPVEFRVDVKDVPEMKEWAEKVARLCERTYPMINEELKSEGFTPARVIRMTLKKDYAGVAAASGDRIVGSVKFFKDNPDDVGAMIHETAHVVQHYRGRGNPGWLVEGVADYVRFFKFEPGKIGRIDANRAHYNGSYRVSAAFLAYLTEKYDREIVLKLNRLMREGNYKEEAFKESTGKTVQELDEEWRMTLRPSANQEAK